MASTSTGCGGGEGSRGLAATAAFGARGVVGAQGASASVVALPPPGRTIQLRKPEQAPARTGVLYGVTPQFVGDHGPGPALAVLTPGQLLAISGYAGEAPLDIAGSPGTGRDVLVSWLRDQGARSAAAPS